MKSSLLLERIDLVELAANLRKYYQWCKTEGFYRHRLLTWIMGYIDDRYDHYGSDISETVFEVLLEAGVLKRSEIGKTVTYKICHD